jgi:hypothetical protein
MQVITEDMKIKATRHLDDLNSFRSLAYAKHFETVGKIGEEQTFADAQAAAEKYEATLKAYALAGFTNLGMHNVKSYANAKVGA